jgi:DNA-binding transcriptional ArsR family regulator
VPHQPLHRFKAEFFRALGHPARLRILELLRPGEMAVSELQAALEIEASSVSQQLAILRAKNIVNTRRAGTSVYYSVRDPQIFQLLDVAREIFNNHLIDLQSMLETQTLADSEQPGNGKLAVQADGVAAGHLHRKVRKSLPTVAPPRSTNRGSKTN